jgi:hypothetical protein
MQWNTMQDYYLPNATNRPYSGQIQQGGRDSMDYMSSMYGSPNRQPVMPQFGGGDPYNMYDPRQQQQGGGYGQRGGARPQFDPRMLMQLIYGGMSEDQMFGDSGMGMNDYYDYAPRSRGRRQDYYNQQQQPTIKDPMAGIKPNQIKDPSQPSAPDWWTQASTGFGGGG